MNSQDQHSTKPTIWNDSNIGDSYPLSPLQHGMLFHNLMGRSSGVDIEQIVCTLHEEIDLTLFERAWQRVISRHAILRTAFEWEGLSEPRQNVHRNLELPLETYDWCHLSHDEQEERFSEHLRKDRSKGFDLTSIPLFRIAVFQKAKGTFTFIWTFHHALLDGTSYRLVLQEVFEFYDAFVNGKDLELELPRPYKDYVVWGRQQELSKAETFWRRRYFDLSAPTPLVVDRKADRVQEPASDRGQYEKRLSASVTSSLRQIAVENDLTLNTFVQGAWAVLLSSYSNESDVVFGVTRACRHSSLDGLGSMLGLFINTIPMRVKVDTKLSVLDFFRSVRNQHVELRAYENTPLVKIQEWSGIGPGSPLFESIIVFDNAELNKGMKALGENWVDRDFRVIEQTNYPMTLFAYGESELLIRLVFDESRFDAQSVERITGHLETLLTSFANDPQQHVSELCVLTEVERRQMLDEWNATGANFAENVCIHQLFEAQAARTPDQIALAFEDRELTYAEVDRKADQLANKLVDLGVGPDRLVGLSVRRSPEMVIGMLAVLKAGGAYVPLDPEYPRERLEFMIRDADIGVLLVDQVHERQTVTPGIHVVNIEDFFVHADNERSFGVSSAAGPNNLAYVIYTSGSTGVPKGVMVEHRNVVNFFTAIDRLIGTDPGVWLAVTSISFDISVLELLWTLTRGFKVVIQGGNAISTFASDGHKSQRPMDFSLFYFASDHSENNEDSYRLLLEGAKFADAHQFAAVWTPERHFHSFGGLYPNPSVTGAAIAAITQNVRVRAGSVVLPLHDPLRVAEEWAVVDNISNGRAGVAFASGWHASDFALAPESYEGRKEIMRHGIETVRGLWRGDSIKRRSGDNSDVHVKIYPKPVQSEIPIWLTAAGSPDTFRAAGEAGANLLTNLLGQSIDELAEKIRIYREAYENSGYGPNAGKVTLMLHTYVNDDINFVREKVRKPFTQYLKTSVDLIKNAPWAYPAFQSQSRKTAKDLNETLAGVAVTEADLDALAEHAFDRYFETSGLFGTPESCLDLVNRLNGIGVDEIACLVDFNVDVDSVLAGLEHLDKLRVLSNRSMIDHSIPAQITRHNVTHLQCTPSAARLMMSDTRTADSLKSLTHIALGGEALPAELAREIADSTTAKLYNMYGPTETTIWSTAAPLTGHETNVPIGRPLANTQIYILNRDLQPVPVGIAGELYIGGDGVTRGYLHQPQLTAERFVPDPFGSGSSRLYRTGDLAAYRTDGTIEFLGRVDHQLKIRGYRVEPEEIQSQLDHHPDVKQSVVVARDDASGGKALVAYVVPQELDRSALQLEQIKNWNSVWNLAYGRNGNAISDTKNFAGWNSSFDGKPIPDSEMEEWLDGTVNKIAALKPSKVLEIGCGTGLLLFNIAPFCSEYWATDISSEALDHVKRTKEVLKPTLPEIKLFERRADELIGLPENSFDTIVLNSVIQYFPDEDYLMKVVSGALNLLKPEGNIFIGDVRSFPLLEAFHTSVELQRASDLDSCSDLLMRVKDRIDREQELAVAPEFFWSLQEKFGQISGVEITLKKARHQNELTKFRYDVRLKVGTAGQSAFRPNWLRWTDELSTADDFRNLLSNASDEIVAVTGVPNQRIRSECEALELLRGALSSKSVTDLRNALDKAAMPALDPAELCDLANGSELSTSIRWSSAGIDRFDVVFCRGVESDVDLSTIRPCDLSPKPTTELTNQPKNSARTVIAARLRTYLKERLPEYMVPSAFVTLDEMPLTPNGKLDRSALPTPENGHDVLVPTFTGPANDVEEAVADIWTEILGIGQVGSDQSFFHVGGHSLLATQLVSRLRTSFRVNIGLREVFDFPTVAGIAECLSRKESEPGQTKKIAQIIKQVKQMTDRDQDKTVSQRAHAQ